MKSDRMDEDIQKSIRKKIHEITGIYTPNIWSHAFLAHIIDCFLIRGVSKEVFLENMSRAFDSYKSQREEQQ